MNPERVLLILYRSSSVCGYADEGISTDVCRYNLHSLSYTLLSSKTKCMNLNLLTQSYNMKMFRNTEHLPTTQPQMG